MTTTTHVEAIDRSVDKANVWLKDMTTELGGERHEAYAALRAVLHTLRDRLTVDEAAQLGAQLPLVIRGIYYENWDPSDTPQSYSHARAFLDRVAADAGYAGDTEAGYAVRAAAAVLRFHISEGEMDDVRAQLPAGVRVLFEE
jgi:uncharacterized protein (DUF2267 family)